MLILAKRLLHDEESARDIVHDVFASLLSGNVKTATVRERLNSLYAVDCQEIEDDKWPDDEDIAKLNDIVDSHLPEQTRRIVRLRFCELMTYKEISKLLSISEVSVYKHLRHAMNVLRQYFNEHER